MIPGFNTSGVLPPFLGLYPTAATNVAPFRATMSELVSRFATSPERIAILKGMLDYRDRLRAIGINNGFQWVDGSFVEHVEQNRGRPPADIDLITFAARPIQDLRQWAQLANANLDLFLPDQSKQVFSCDAYFQDLTVPPEYLIRRAAYWFGLFSHQRATNLWKGLLEIPINSDDALARAML